MVTAIVLAAGSSRRMGNVNKLLLPYKGKTIVETTLSNILGAGMDEVIVVTGHEAEKVTRVIQYLPVTIIDNPNHAAGMTTSIQRGIKAAKESGYMICLADMFMITPGEYTLLKDVFEVNFVSDPGLICVPYFQGKKGNPVIFSPCYKDPILQHAEMDGCRSVIQKNEAHIAWVDMPTDHVLQDLDFYEDFEKLVME